MGGRWDDVKKGVKENLMITSMTAFSRKMHEDVWGTLIWELRSVNHRYLEMALRLPESFRIYEKSIRDEIIKLLKRGKIEATLKFYPGTEVPFDFIVNQGLIGKLAAAARDIENAFSNQPLNLNLTDILAWQGVLQTKDTHMGALSSAMVTLLQESLKDLVEMRQREGHSIATFLQKRIADIREQMAVIHQRLPLIQDAEQQRIKTRFAELSLELNPDRLAEEMAWMAQKADIAEELQRLDAHLIEVNRVLEKGGVVGRRLDFLMQELNREANTLSSKSQDAMQTQAAVEIKVLIEQMREQVQNIE